METYPHGGRGWRVVCAVLWAAAVWPLWRWWFVRLWHGEPVSSSVAAWLTVPFLLAAMIRKPEGAAPIPLWKMAAASVALLAFAFSATVLPMSVRAVFAVVSGLFLLQPRDRVQGTIALPLWALAIIGIPSVQMLDLFFGYGLRWVATVLAASLLQAASLPILREGTQLAVNGTTVWVDAPCAGIHMLGAGLWLTLTLAQLNRMRGPQTILAAVSALVAVLLANAARIVVLTLMVCFVREPSSAFHQVVGCCAMLFGACVGAGLTLWIAHRFPSRARRGVRPDTSSRFWPAAVAGYLLCVAVCVTAGFRQAVSRDGASAADGLAETFPGWPERFEGGALQEEPLTGEEAAFNAVFPGRIARFRQGGRVVILRWVTRPTHRVHSAADCLRSSGWRIEPRPLQRRTDGDWSAFLASRNGVSLSVREQARDASGRTFPDVPTWFWRAFLGKTSGPWWVITVTERAPDQES